MHKISSLFFCVLSVHLAHGQFSMPGSGDSSSPYQPRIKLAGPLGQLIGGQGISLNSGLGQVLSSILNTAATGGGASSSGSPLTQLATAASTQYINAIRSLPFGQGLGGGSQQSQHQQQHQPQQHPQQYGQFGHNGPSGHNMYNPINFLTPDNNMYGAQGNFDQGPHFGPNSFPQFPVENYFGNQYGGYNQGGPSSSALYNGGGSSYNGHNVQGHHMDK